MVTGIVLVNVDRPMLRQAINGIFTLPGVTEVYTVAGEYDLVVMIRVATNSELADVIASRMTHDIYGINHTKTLITLNVDAKIDLEKVFNIA